MNSNSDWEYFDGHYNESGNLNSPILGFNRIYRLQGFLNSPGSHKMNLLSFISNDPGAYDDHISSIRQIRPGSNSSIKLGGTMDINDPLFSYNNNYSVSNLAYITYKFKVNPSNPIYAYHYALVLQDPTTLSIHNDEVKSFFNVIIKDSYGKEIPCGNTLYIPHRNSDGWNQIDDPFVEYQKKDQSTNQYVIQYDKYGKAINGANSIFYKNWTTNIVDLSEYINDEYVTVTFCVTGCSAGGHFGYAYLDAECFSNGISVTPSPSYTNNALTFNYLGTESFSDQKFNWIFGDEAIGTLATATTNKSINHTYTIAKDYDVKLNIDIPDLNGSKCDINLTQKITILPSCSPDIPLKYGNNWFFGNGAGIQFTNTGITSKTGSALSNTGAASSISDKEGNLLFYTDGTKIYNKNNDIMEGGDLYGGFVSGSSQYVQGIHSGLICPYPGVGNEKKYYVFTVDKLASYTAHIAYSKHYLIVDMAANGGLGKVMPSSLDKYGTGLTLTENPESQKMEIVKNSTGDGYWFITADHWGIRVYEIDANGLNTTPRYFDFPNSTGFGRSFGYMKASPSGRLLALANFRASENGVGYGASELFDFDPATGVVSNKRSIYTGNKNDDFYGVEFSPDETFLYLTTQGNMGATGYPENFPAALYQFDISDRYANSFPPVIISPTDQNDTKPYTEYQFGDLQLGPDGKIYMAIVDPILNSKVLGTINNPNAFSTGCNFNFSGVILDNTNGSSTFSLPNIPGYQVMSPNLIGSASIACLSTISLAAVGGELYNWTLPNGTKSTSSIINILNASKANEGVYTVEIIKESGCSVTKTISVTVNCESCDPNSSLRYSKNWHFGNGAAIQFTSSGVTDKSGCAIYNTQASNSISDKNGNLLFYTNGEKVYNKNNAIMDGGKLFSNAYYNTSDGYVGQGAQSGTICPYPGNENKYFIFTVLDGYPRPKNYMIVDMSANDGLGKVILNSYLVTGIGQRVTFDTGETEKMEIVKNAAGDGYWLITVNSTGFKVYKIDTKGFHTTPQEFSFPYSRLTGRNLGYMQASPSGKLLALANFKGSNNGAGFGESELFDFNTATGEVSNKRSIYTGSRFDDFYGVEFSPDEKILYFSTQGSLNNSGYPAALYQYKISNSNMDSPIIISPSDATSLNPYTDYQFGALQLGPDGKIYMAIVCPSTNSKYLGVINNPNSNGTNAGFNLLGLKLGTANGSSTFSLPNIPGFEVVSPDILGANSIACRSTISLAAEGGESYNWTLPDGTKSNLSGINLNGVAQTDEGVYSVEIIKEPGCSVTKTITITVNCETSTYCVDCVPSFAPIPENKYLISGWVKKSLNTPTNTYTGVGLGVYFKTRSSDTQEELFTPSGPIIDGWQRVEASFVVPKDATNIVIELVNDDSNVAAYFDDIRVHPFKSNMKSFVYDPSSQKLVAELDENNYATKYEYDDEGILIRVKKETERGVMTIKETRNNQSKLSK